ncbi:MAG: sarcosine oxidase subunit delta [Pseudomonadota bacterium]
MMLIHCPFCGPRDQSEFTYLGDASITYPPLDAPYEAWCDAIFLRENPRGVAVELWQHTLGCRSFLKIVRNTLTHEILSVEYASPTMAAAMAAEAGLSVPPSTLPGEAAE